MFRKNLGVGLALVGLALAACSTKTGGNADGGDIPEVDIGECQTAQGEQPYADAIGEDYTTQLKEPGKLHVGSDNAYPPFEEIKPGSADPEGFDVDLYEEVATRLGLDAVSTTTGFDALFTESVPSGTFDLGVSAITIKEERKQTVDFSMPYYVSDLSLAINVEETPEIETIDDLVGLTIGAQKGTTGETCADALVAQGKAKEVRSYDDSALAFQDLEAGRVAAIVNDRPASVGFIEKNPDVLKVITVIKTSEEYGFAISKDKPDLRVKIDETLTAMMEDGTYATIYEKWFDTPPPFEVPIS